MKLITIRDFRSRSRQIQNELPKYHEMVITSNGKPIAIMSAVTERDFERSLKAIRASRVASAVDDLQSASIMSGRNKLMPSDINKEIAASRKTRR